MEDQKVTVYYKTDPKRTRQVTKQAAEYLSNKWAISDDQPQAEKKAPAVVPAASAVVDRKPELQREFKELTGTDADPDWNQARLFIEISKAKKLAAKPIEAPAAPEPAAEPEQPAKRKSTKKAKSE